MCCEGHQSIFPCTVDNSAVTSDSAQTETSLVELTTVVKSTAMITMDKESKTKGMISPNEGPWMISFLLSSGPTMFYLFRRGYPLIRLHIILQMTIRGYVTY